MKCLNFIECIVFYFILNVSFTKGLFDNQPKLLTDNGNLILMSAPDKNITVRLNGNSWLNVNGINVFEVIREVQQINTISPTSDNDNGVMIQGEIRDIKLQLYGPQGLEKRVSSLENSTRVGSQNFRIRNALRRVSRLETKVDRLLSKVSENNCRINSCQNGGTCVDLYDGFLCRCPKNWEGATCAEDVNECALFSGTDLGCQNGAQCINLPGGYNCICTSGWLGLHCTRRKSDCLTSSNSEMCGNGKCVNSNDAFGYTCICNQGWKTNGVTPACVIDVDECSEVQHKCASACINLPGSYTCAPCPPGFTGNSLICIDIDECNINNGGCSMSPSVPCLNTHGSFRCGECPLGWQGDGKICTRDDNGLCSRSDICYPQATCREISNTVVCSCPHGMTGHGVGINGCVAVTVNSCSPNPCQNGGNCTQSTSGYICQCPPNTLPPNCRRSSDSCYSNPCRNGGTCASNSVTGRFRCLCPTGFRGRVCQTIQRSCGGVLTEPSGVLKYPLSSNYGHNERCAWLIRTNATLVLNVTFTQFDIEYSPNCLFDWLQIHDGASTAGQLIGRFCGTNLPKGGTIISTHNMLYLWFRSDNSSAKDGFELTWESITPICGGFIDAGTTPFGTISSPGSPGNYPPNRDCEWRIEALFGKRIQINFFTMQLESHETCGYDYLAVYSGSSADGEPLEKYCNASHPAPLLTPFNEALLHFHSDAEGTDSGFQIHYAVVEGFPGCGGVYTSVKGEFGSPSQDGLYPHNLKCEYLIQLTKGSKIQIVFTRFQLERSDGCIFDYVEIFEGRSEQDRKVGRWCGSQLPPEYKSESNILLIVFKSDFSSSGEGFRLTYDIACGGNYGDESSIITSPLYPNPYAESRTCVFKIEAPLGKIIELEFQDFDLEDNDDCYYDFIEVYDGLNSNASAKLCGIRIPNKLISTHNLLTLHFVTDSSVAGRGFKANYSFVEIGCGGVLTRPHMVITPPMESDEYDANYRHGSNCNWVLAAPNGFVVQLTWLYFRLEDSSSCSYDFVEIYDQTSNGDQKIGRFCGSDVPPTIVSTGNVLTVKFVTDMSQSAGGFSFTYFFMNGRNLCGGTYHTESGNIRSPGWPDNYPGEKECTWILSVATGMQIELKVKTFNLERSDGCRFDYLEIRNGGKSDSPLIDKYCGVDIPHVIPSHTHELYLKFVSDNSISYEGFDIEWDGSLMGCGGQLTSYQGMVVSPNYPQSYSHNAQCDWRIVVTKGSSLRIAISDIDLEDHSSCNFDYLEIYDGHDSTAHKLGKYCKNRNNPFFFFTSENEAFIRFVTDSSNAARGFQLFYSLNCKRDFNNFHGVIESPNFPDIYPDGMDCEWKIQATMGNQLAISFSHFDLEDSSWGSDEDQNCVYDFVEIEDFDDEVSKGKNKYCGTNLPNFNSTGNVVVIKFITDSSKGASGFRLEYQSVGCGGLLLHPSGEISSPNYPKPYPHAVVCEWLIQAPYGQRIELNITDFNIEHQEDCAFDGLLIANGENETHAIATYCGKNTVNETIVTSNGRSMFVKFYADTSRKARGFFAKYKSIASKCGAVLMDPKGIIYSPNYPKNYETNMECEWLISLREQSTINMTIVDFDLEYGHNCQHDYLEIYDADNRNPDALLMRHCGQQLPNVTNFSSTGRVMLVVFSSDESNEAKGFKLSYEKNCGQEIKVTDTGSIKLNNLNEPYGECVWILVAEKLDQHITFITTAYHHSIRVLMTQNSEIDCTNSGVTFYDGDSTESPVKSTPCSGHFLPVISEGHALTIKVELGLVWNFEGFYSVFDNACGGQYKSLHGKIASPMYPYSYPLNVQCIYEISTSDGNSIELNMQSVNLETSEHCNNDYIEVREGGAAGKLLKTFCGNDIPNKITAKQNMWIKFNSDDNDVGGGFYAEYNYARHNDINGDGGLIKSPGYEDSIPFNGSYTWRITVQRGNVIQITLLDLIEYHTTYYSENLKVFDGYDETAFSLDIDDENPSVLSNTNIVFIVTDGIHFNLRWTAISKTSLPANDTQNSTCVNEVITVTNQSYVLKSPGFPFGYDANLKCNWTILSIDQTLKPLVIFNEIDLDDSSTCYADHVSVSKSSNLVTWTEIDKVCKMPDSPVKYIGTPYLKIDFITDYYFNKTGFQATIFPVCGGHLTAPENLITGTNLFFDPVNKICEWTLSVRRGRVIQFEFANLNLPKDDTGICSSYVMIKNGIDEDSPILGIGKYCGTDIINIPLTSSNKAYIKFEKKNPSLETWVLNYKEIVTECGGSITLNMLANSTEITSPNYPHIPTPHIQCVWVIQSPLGERMQIDFIGSFDLTSAPRCEKEYVEIKDGGTQLAPTLGLLCDKPPNSIHTTGNMLRLKFFTDTIDPKTGFKVRISIDKCGGVYRESEGVITSKNYPTLGGYPARYICEYRIIQPAGTIINIYFNEINLPAGSDNCENVDSIHFYSVYRTGGIESETSELSPVCGNFITNSFSPNSNEVLIRFKTFEPNIAYKGFKLTYNTTFDLCGGMINSENGVLSTPGYPNGWRRRLTCNWRIEVPKGRRIKLNIIDLDFGTFSNSSVYPSYGSMASVFNDFQYLSKIGMLSRNSPNELDSTDNLMMITGRLILNAGQRGLKFSFNSNERTICNGDFDSSAATILPPSQNLTSYFCTYDINLEQDTTLSIDLTDLVVSSNISAYVCRMGAPFLVSFPQLQNITVCENTTQYNILLPIRKAYIQIVRTQSIDFLDYKINYKKHPCGGVLSTSSSIFIKNPILSSSYGSVRCAWQINAENEDINQIYVNGFINFNGQCNDEYITIYNGLLPTDPKLNRFCGTTNISNIKMEPRLLIEYHSENYNLNSGFNITVEPAADCGGIIKWPFRSITFTKEDYKNNVECIWDVRTSIGYHIGITFVDRFFIENSNGCVKDYLEISEKDHDNFKTITRICGRETPSSLNSTGNDIRIIFRSDDSTTGDGFKIRFENNCGGTFEVDQQIKTIVSPNYPMSYNNTLSCNYTLVAPKTNVIYVKFLDFDIESSRRCIFDNLTLYRRNEWEYNPVPELVKTYCNKNELDELRYKGWISLIFKTDETVASKGFKFEYKIDECGATITNNTLISSPKISADHTYSAEVNCFWNISTDLNYKISIQFEDVDFLLTEGCRYDYVEVYSGKKPIEANRKAKLCGNLSGHVSPISINEKNALIHSHMASSGDRKGFTALISFKVMCDGEILLTENNPTYDFANFSSSYELNMDCVYIFKAPNGYNIKIEFSQFHLAPCNSNVTDNCSCDFVEIRDGGGPFSELIDKYCGHTTPPMIISSKSRLFVRFVSDTQVTSTGIRATVSIVPATCGTQSGGVITLNQKLDIKSPDYPVYKPNLRCFFMVNASNNIQLHFESFDLQEPDESGQCVYDFLEIQTNNDEESFDQLGENTIYSGSQSNKVQTSFFTASTTPITSHKFCGSHIPSDYYTESKLLIMKFKTDAETEKRGFEITATAEKGCHKNYTSTYGRIKGENNVECEVYIKVPSNYTISLYFNTISFYDSSCTTQKIEIFDNNNGNLLKSICGQEPAKSVFTNSNFLKLTIKNEEVYSTYDITYIASDSGIGCGGEIFNYGGIFTSPLYPLNDRNNSDCRWNLRVPQNLKVALSFEVFDLGSKTTCSSDFLEIIEIEDNATRDDVVRQYCGEDNPGVYRGRRNYLAVRFKKTVNYDGTGWIIRFAGLHEDSKLPEW